MQGDITEKDLPIRPDRRRQFKRAQVRESTRKGTERQTDQAHPPNDCEG